jgi:hypothetical protein
MASCATRTRPFVRHYVIDTIAHNPEYQPISALKLFAPPDGKKSRATLSICFVIISTARLKMIVCSLLSNSLLTATSAFTPVLELSNVHGMMDAREQTFNG